jgi:3-dehydroquinate dehydratase/shikimate dehydrogenase
MICVSIGRGRHRHVIAEHKHFVEQGAPLVELRLDYINGRVNLRRILENRPGPVIVTCRRERDGGKWKGSEDDRIVLLRQAIAEGVEYVDLEEDVATSIPRFGKTKRIISLHNFQKTPNNLSEIHENLCGLDPDVVKIATMANSTRDNSRILRLMHEAKIPTVGLCMGEIGTPTRILAGCYGAPFTYATFHHERTLAPGQLTFREMLDVYHYDELNEETEVYGVIGDPIRHSLSPLIHNAAFREMGLNKVYLPFRVARSDLAMFLQDAKSFRLKGLSVTIPHKVASLTSLTKFDGAVRRVGAVNTIVFDGDDLIGYNTDYRAAMASLENALGGLSNGTSPLKGSVALLLGAGGAAKSIAHGLRRRGCDVVIANRTAMHAEQLANEVGCRAVPWDQRHGVTADVVVNTTPVGMHPDVDESPLESHYLKPSMLVFDAVYNPESTLLIKDARRRQCKVVTGVDMFVRQAALQFKYFTGLEAPEELMRAQIRRATSAVKY